MKKRIILPLACLLLCGIFAGCQPTADSGAVPAADMQLAPMQCSDEQYRVLSLANINPQEFIAYEYQADENLRCITTTRYILNDALEWEPADSGSGRIYNDTPISPTGAFALTDKGDGQGFTHVLRESGESSSGYTSSAPGLPEEIAAGGLAVGIGTQSEAVSIVYGEEIPILVRTFRDKSELYVYDAAKDFADPSRFKGDLFTEAFTVTFSDTIPE
ncbi:hypothetical protein [Agathobaculum sp. Marseille-P7918]|uniref:hypothetical protein n=1 Tax=Agathobaculum sp. Marseille-P7918 TaxID=2479843 RepID=UPI000F6360CB|nr:hypothetical protein [Agathobaculum sp. Marseille-P7918]